MLYLNCSFSKLNTANEMVFRSLKVYHQCFLIQLGFLCWIKKQAEEDLDVNTRFRSRIKFKFPKSQVTRKYSLTTCLACRVLYLAVGLIRASLMCLGLRPNQLCLHAKHLPRCYEITPYFVNKAFL